MKIATISSKRQFTIPKEIREKLGLKAGDKVVVTAQDDGSATIRKTKKPKEAAKP